MKVFVGWPYEATWVDDYVIPLAESYGITVLTGKELQGKVITRGVKERIAEADAALFITARRGGPDEKGKYETSDWVLDEIKHANSIEKPVIIEVREDGVEYENKIHADRQYIPCDPDDRMKCLVELGKTIGQRLGPSLKLKVSPLGDAADKQAFILGLNQKKGYDCTYQIRQQGKVIYENVRPVEIVREGQDYFIYTDELPAKFFNLMDVYLEVEVDTGDTQWSAYGIRFNNPLEVPLERLDSVQFSVKRREV
jgi:hypothetical protein